MLKFTKKSGFYIIEEKIIGSLNTYFHYIWYTDDIKYKKIDSESWQKTTMADREWFNKHYRHKFKEK